MEDKFFPPLFSLVRNDKYEKELRCTRRRKESHVKLHPTRWPFRNGFIVDRRFRPVITISNAHLGSPEPTCWQRSRPGGGCTGWSFRVSEDGWWLGQESGGYYLVCSLLSLICTLLFVPLPPTTLHPPPPPLPLTRIHTHVYSHSNQLRRLFFGPRHASRLFAASPARREAPQGPRGRDHYYFSALFAYRTALSAVYASSPCNVSGGQRDVSGSQWCSWVDDEIKLFLSPSLFIQFDLLYSRARQVDALF